MRPTIPALLLAASSVLACEADAPPPLDPTIFAPRVGPPPDADDAERIAHVLRGSGVPDARLGPPLVAGNLTVWPLYGGEFEQAPHVLTLHDAWDEDAIEIREEDSATVGTVKIVNRADRPVLALAGTVILGGKQDRQLGADTILLANSSARVAAFCIERGRWAGERQGAATAGRFRLGDRLAMKQVRASAQHVGDQGRVWSNVSRINARAGRSSVTDSLAATVGEGERAPSPLELRVREALGQSLWGLPPVGYAYAIKGEPVALRTFATADLLARSLPPLVRTLCQEAELVERRDREAGREPYEQAAETTVLVAVLEGIDAAPQARRGRGTGSQLLRRANGWGGHAATLLSDGVRITQDWSAAVQYGEKQREVLYTLEGLGYTGD